MVLGFENECHDVAYCGGDICRLVGQRPVATDDDLMCCLSRNSERGCKHDSEASETHDGRLLRVEGGGEEVLVFVVKMESASPARRRRSAQR